MELPCTHNFLALGALEQGVFLGAGNGRSGEIEEIFFVIFASNKKQYCFILLLIPPPRPASEAPEAPEAPFSRLVYTP
jgi:hypothetical protein